MEEYSFVGRSEEGWSVERSVRRRVGESARLRETWSEGPWMKRQRGRGLVEGRWRRQGWVLYRRNWWSYRHRDRSKQVLVIICVQHGTLVVLITLSVYARARSTILSINLASLSGMGSFLSLAMPSSISTALQPSTASASTLLMLNARSSKGQMQQLSKAMRLTHPAQK